MLHGDMATDDVATDETALASAIEARYAPLLPEGYRHRDRALAALAFVHRALDAPPPGGGP